MLAREEAVVEALESNVVLAQLLLHPLMAVETELHGIWEIGANFDEGRSPLPIVDVEVEVIDGHGLA